ncbi:MAG: hypothetical protein LUE92_10265 [Clostridiales bacterium]|nr:hypothetical protein [Clostridiales bacterium]
MKHPEMFYLLEEGDVFHLGDRDLIVQEVPGHTLGSIGLLDEKNHVFFSGDGIGSNAIYQQLEYSTSLVVFRETLKKLIKKFEAMPDVKIYTQHQSLKKVHDLTYLKKLCQITDDLITGKRKGIKLKHNAYIGSAMLVKWPILIYQYDPQKIR